MRILTEKELKKDMLKNKEKYVGKNIYAEQEDGTIVIGKIVGIDEHGIQTKILKLIEPEPTYIG